MMNDPLMNRAATVRFTDIVTWQAPLPVQALYQVLKACPSCVEGVRVTTTPWLNLATHPVAAATPAVILQLIPAGLEVTTPVPVPPPPFTVSVFCTTAASGAATGAVGSGTSPQAWSMARLTMPARRTAGPESKRLEGIRHPILGRGLRPGVVFAMHPGAADSSGYQEASGAGAL